MSRKDKDKDKYSFADKVREVADREHRKAREEERGRKDYSRPERGGLWRRVSDIFKKGDGHQ